MKTFTTSLLAVLSFSLLLSTASAHSTEPGSQHGNMIVTRHFTGIWDQVDHESQGIALQVIEQFDDSRRAVGYWYTYGADRKTAWFMGIGELVDDRIEFELFDSTDVGFLQSDEPGDESVQSIGTMTIDFDSCVSGTVSYLTTHEEVGSGSFEIERILEIMNTHCTGGISDDMHADGWFGEQRIELRSAREGLNGRGYARYEDYPAHMEFEIEVEDLPDGMYRLYVGGRDRGEFEVMDGRGEIRFTSPAEDGHRLMNFDPRGMQIEVHDGPGIVLSSFDRQFEQDHHQHQGGGHGGSGHDDHAYDCDSGHMGGGMGGGHMGGGMRDCVNDGDYLDIEVDLLNTGVLADAKGEAEWDMNSVRVRFSVEIEDVPAGFYPLHVGGAQVGIIEAFEMHYGGVYGRITFRDPEASGPEHLDFEPRGQVIRVMQGEAAILEVEFPEE